MLVRPRQLDMIVSGALALGYVALALRPGGSAAAFVVTLGAGVIGLGGPLPRRGPGTTLVRGGPAQGTRWTASVIIGTAAFALAHATGPHVPPAAGPLAVLPAGLALRFLVMVILAAVAEEAFFRRLLYGWLAVWGPAIAVVGTALLFAAAHLPASGLRAVPVMLAAGLVFGWQRRASGAWTAAGLTHVFANLLAVGAIG